MRIALLFFFLFSSVITSKAYEQYRITNFMLSDNLEKPDRINIIVTDSLDQPLDGFSGTYNFTINGFRQALNFQDGIATSSLEITKSLFLYVKHENESDSVSKLYYLHKKSSGLNPISINWYVLLIIPAFFILIGYMFRRLIGFVIFLLMAYMYFNYSKGLSFSTFIESVIDGLKGLF